MAAPAAHQQHYAAALPAAHHHHPNAGAAPQLVYVHPAHPQQGGARHVGAAAYA